MRKVRSLALGLCLVTASTASAADDDATARSDRALREWAHTVGSLGYVHGAPLLELSIAEYRQTQGLSRDLSAPRGLLAHAHGGRLPSAATTWQPAPDPDVLVSSAWLDLAAQPYVLFVPPMDGHWYSVSLVDAFGNVTGVVSARTHGSVGGWFLLAQADAAPEPPPGLNGELRVASPTGWLLVRIAATPRDQAKRHEHYQARLQLLPLSVYARNPKAASFAKAQPQPGLAPAPRASAEMRGTLDAFRLIHRKLRVLPAPPAERMLLALFDRAGFGPSVDFDPAGLPSPVVEGLRSAARDAERQLADLALAPSGQRSAWGRAPSALGASADDLLLRALAATHSLGAELPEETLVLETSLDADGRRLDGRVDYVLRFPASRLPPAEAFWSVAAYASETRRLFEAPRHSVTSLDRALVLEPDGSLVLQLSSDEPEDPARRANWLPLRVEPFFLVARLHQPLPAALAAGYTLPPVVPADD